MPIYIYISFKVLPVQFIKLLPGVGPISDRGGLTAEMIYITESGFDQACPAGPKESVHKFMQMEFLEREAHFEKRVSYFYAFNVDV